MERKAEEAITDSRERTADTPFTDLESLALALEGEGTDLNITDNRFVPTAKCIEDTNERQLVTRSGLQRRRCCFCHFHPEQAMKAPYRVRQFFAKVLQTTLQPLMSLLEMPMRQHTNTTREGVPRFVQILSCRHVERNVTRDGTPT